MSKLLITILKILAVMVLMVFLVSVLANLIFNQKVNKEIKELFSSTPKKKNDIITVEDMAGLPACVQRWLLRSGVIGKERIRTVRLKQKGLMRLAEDKPWMSAEAEQYFTVDEPGFVWKVKVNMAPLLYFTGRDKYFEGKGTMLIKVLSLIPVVNSEGKEMDQGTLLRYLAEMPWFPTGALCSYIKWEEIDANSARATMSYKGVSASGVFTFNEQGDLISFIANRYRETKGKYELTEWGGLSREYKEFNGIRIPSKTDVVWRLESGDFDWYRLEITDIDYNKPIIY